MDREIEIRGLTVDDGVYDVPIFHRDELSKHDMKRQLRCIGEAHDDVATDENVNAVSCGTDDRSDDTKYSASNEPVPSTENIRQSSNDWKEDRETDIVNEGYPDVIVVGSKVFVNYAQQRCNLSAFVSDCQRSTAAEGTHEAKLADCSPQAHSNCK
jgi:hypothetical protein